MRVGEARATRTLALLILLGIANHSVLSGSRVIVSLDALSMGASPFTVGVLMSLYALLPMLLSVAAGRVSDRIGTRWPMRVGSALIAIGAILPVALPGFPALFAGPRAALAVREREHARPSVGALHDQGRALRVERSAVRRRRLAVCAPEFQELERRALERFRVARRAGPVVPPHGREKGARPAPLSEIKPGVHYVDLSRFDRAAFEKALDTLQGDKGIIFDLRGYPSGDAVQVVKYWLTGEDKAQWMFVPRYDKPYAESKTAWSIGWQMGRNGKLDKANFLGAHGQSAIDAMLTQPVVRWQFTEVAGSQSEGAGVVIEVGELVTGETSLAEVLVGEDEPLAVRRRPEARPVASQRRADRAGQDHGTAALLGLRASEQERPVVFHELLDDARRSFAQVHVPPAKTERLAEPHPRDSE